MILNGVESARDEKFHIKMVLDKRACDRNPEKIMKIIKQLPCDMVDGDTYTMNYFFEIGYFGEIVDRFEAILELIEQEGVVAKCKHEELIHGECLVEKVILALRKIELKLHPFGQPK